MENNAAKGLVAHPCPSHIRVGPVAVCVRCPTFFDRWQPACAVFSYFHPIAVRREGIVKEGKIRILRLSNGAAAHQSRGGNQNRDTATGNTATGNFHREKKGEPRLDGNFVRKLPRYLTVAHLWGNSHSQNGRLHMDFESATARIEGSQSSSLNTSTR